MTVQRKGGSEVGGIGSGREEVTVVVVGGSSKAHGSADGHFVSRRARLSVHSAREPAVASRNTDEYQVCVLTHSSLTHFIHTKFPVGCPTNILECVCL